MARHGAWNGTRRVQFAEASTVVTWLHGIAAHAASRRQWDVLEEATQTMCTWDGAWDQWRAQDKIRPWLESLKGKPQRQLLPYCETIRTPRATSAVSPRAGPPTRAIRQAVREA
ncbi:hypothetical protein [Streptomyces sp. NPDC005407]|uniref:hypothetical protein n=1 Tax=Streptomyces sp. NPDC005407 TaxID=3155340 RepID=UPI0033AEAA6F